MNHPYGYPFAICMFAVAAASLTFIWLCIRRDRRERDQHRWEKSTRATPDDLTDRAVNREFRKITGHLNDGPENP